MLSKSCGYAIRGTVYLALKIPENRKVGIQELADALDVPLHFMGKIMQNLARCEIVNSTKGPHGGFFLQQTALATPVIALVEAIDGLDVFRRCALNLPNCSESNPCSLHKLIAPHRKKIYQLLCQRTVRDLMADVQSGRTNLREGALPDLS
ncbi:MULTISPECIES: Rrf2 family transcriptional regulator [unclassified Spirosoma]|uniref:RrF2 family transcriptional regulator n=1 Tax=unclassified Spirosoma TaxID=2621999 RepID=UPI0009636F1A|nr:MULTISPECIES: Rrf2 family transcriptional regulator [unclassified Spirosoma]MBN8820435.1 Rrf2 family transcriptional regulator [Spirosoma sp.]OJW70016.1 MAG: hypothetical protein BGO59_03380 [Spirosoma sp. 48-14]